MDTRAASQPLGTTGAGELTPLTRLVPSPLLFALGFLSAIAQVTYSEGLMFGEHIETMAVARSLAHTGSFANPFSAAPTGPTAHLPPLYPALLAVFLRVFGDTASTAVPLVLMAACFYGLHTALLPAVAARFIGRRDAGVIAALLSTVIPVFQLQPHWDSAAAAAGVLGFCLLADWAFRLGPTSLWRASVAGLCLGLLLLLNPSVILVALPLLAWLCLRRGLPLRMPFAAALAAALVCLPWVTRNYLVLGEVGVLRDNLGLELYVSNNDCAQSSGRLIVASGCVERRHPSHSLKEANLVRQLGEPAYNRSRLGLALEWAQANPAAFWRLTARRVVEFWLPHPYAFAPFAHGIWLVTAMSVPGLYRMSRDRAPVAAFFYSVLLIYPLLYYLVQSDMRYRYPIFWISLIAAGYGLTRLRWLSPARCASVGAVLLVSLARPWLWAW